MNEVSELSQDERGCNSHSRTKASAARRPRYSRRIVPCLTVSSQRGLCKRLFAVIDVRVGKQ